MYKSKEDQEDAELRQVLNKSSNGNDEVIKGSITWRRQKSQPNTPTSTMYHNFQNNRSSTLNGNGTLGDGDDEILESLVKTATRTSDTRVATRERKRNTGVNRNSTERKSRKCHYFVCLSCNFRGKTNQNKTISLVVVKRSRTRENNVATSLYDVLM